MKCNAIVTKYIVMNYLQRFRKNTQTKSKMRQRNNHTNYTHYHNSDACHPVSYLPHAPSSTAAVIILSPTLPPPVTPTK